MRKILGLFKINKYGGSSTVLIPKKTLDYLDLKLGDLVPVEFDEEKGELIFKLKEKRA